MKTEYIEMRVEKSEKNSFRAAADAAACRCPAGYASGYTAMQKRNERIWSCRLHS
jgi:hypothetical protein